MTMAMESASASEWRTRKTFASSNPKIGNLSFMNLQNSRRLYQNKLIRRQLESTSNRRLLLLLLLLLLWLLFGGRELESLDDDEGPPTKQ